MKLEAGVGFSRRGSLQKGKYKFSPRITGEDVIFLDLHPPESRELTKLGAGWVVGDAQHMPFKDNTFDEIYSSHLIEHLPHPLKFLKECHRVLKPGGTLRLWCPNIMSKNMYLDPSHVFKPNPYTMKKLLKRAKFSEIHFDCPAVGSLLPNPIRFIIRSLYLLIANDIRVIAWKE